MNRRRRPVKSTLVRQVRRLLLNRRAATAVEYGLIVSLIVISMIAAFTSVAEVTINMWNNVSDAVTSSN